MSQKIREETYREDELRRTLEEINRDMKPSRDKSRDKDRERRSRDKDEGRRSNKDRDEEKKSRRDGDDRKNREGERKHRDRDGDERRHRDKDSERRHREKDEDRKTRDKGDDRRHRDKDDERRHKDREDERKHRDKDDDRRRRDRDKGDEERKHRERGDGDRRQRDKDDERRHKDKDDERRRRDKDDERRHRDKDDERRRRDKDDERRHRDKDDERRHRDRGDDERRHRDKDDERRRRAKDDERRHRDTDDERRSKDDRRRKEDEHRTRDKERGTRREEETEEERERRKKEERRQRRKAEEEEKRRLEEEKRRKEEEEKQKAAAEEEADDGYDDYEDDFEAYDDDFENDSESGHVNIKNKEMADILRAMSAENDELSRQRSPQRNGSAASSSTVGDLPQTRAAPKSFINFVSARTRTADAAVANRTRQRSRELLRLINLDSATYEMFELAEMEEYRLYMRRFGSAAASQVACQTHEDALERETQCDPIERRSVWTQQPPDDLAAAGDDDKKPDTEEEVVTRSQDVMTSRSLFRSAQLMLRLLEEEARPHMAPPEDQDRGSGLSNGYTNISSPKAFYLDFCTTRPSLLLSLSGGSPSKLCVWNVTSPREPQDTLQSPAKALCARFSPLGPALVFAGCEDGSVVLWDLREPRAWHPGPSRAPTFITAAVLEEENHAAPVIDILALPSVAPFGQQPSAFQIATLDAAGVVQLWVTSQLGQADPAGSEADLGLRPGGRVRLSRAARLQPAPLLSWNAGLARKVPGSEVSSCFTSSSEPGAFLVGSELGMIHQIARNGARLYPRRYLVSSPSPVRSLDICPFEEPFYLAGYDDGSVRIFHVSHDLPLLEYTDFSGENGIIQVAWSRSRPAVFFVLDGNGNIFVWDLMVEENRPIRKETPGKTQGRKVKRMVFSEDHRVTGRGERGRKPQMGLCFDQDIEVHELNEAFCVGELDETYRVKNLLDSFV